MSSTKKVLPNFVKTLVIASLATISVSAFAGHHEKGENKMPELKDMKAKSTELKAEELTSELDGNADVTELEAEAKSMMDEKSSNAEVIAEEAKPQL
jgi:hypothetical protein